MRLFIITIILTLFSTTLLFAGEIGKSWEFNGDGNSEGWEPLAFLSELSVSDGTLKATVTGDLSQLGGPVFDLTARDYGFVQIRMKAVGPQSVTISWAGDSTTFAFKSFVVIGDSAFHEYEIPIYKSSNWKGQIQQITRITMRAKVGSTIEIDYFRILGFGTRPAIDVFKPLRTILKPCEKIPLMAVVKNSGDRAGALTSVLSMPNDVELLFGDSEKDHGILSGEETDTLSWTVSTNRVGEFPIKLLLFSEDDTTESVMNANFADEFWKLDKFFLSAWSPPSLTTDAFDYYSDANFNMVLWLPPDEGSVLLAEQNNMQYILRAGSLLGEHLYLRAPENTRPEELTPNDLAKLDGMIDLFKNRENVLGYYLTDEPNALAFENLGKVVNYLREKDPTRLSYINLFPTYANEEQLGTPTYENHLEQFIDTIKPELLSYDHYHFFNGRDGGGYFTNLGLIRKWALKYDIPFCNIIQAIGTDGTSVDFLNWRIPTANEHRWLVYSTLAYGGKGIVWFHWDHAWGLTSSPKRDELYASIQQLNKEIERLGPVLITLKSTAVYHTQFPQYGPLPENNVVKSISTNDDLIVGLYRDKDDGEYMMFMNKDYKNSVTTTIMLARSFENIFYFDVDTNQWENVNFENTTDGAVFELGLSPGHGILYKVGETTDVKSNSPKKLPTEFGLEQNYPNPFNADTTIEYKLAETGPVKLVVNNVLGRNVAVLVEKRQTRGSHKITWPADLYPSGIYICSLFSGTEVSSRKMLLLK